ncbi:MAG: hypothetical protein M5T61_18895 [Acidimicrobiia bacterium]|nr:hypothetical protein [Acidimicrobiia bacterium]
MSGGEVAGDELVAERRRAGGAQVLQTVSMAARRSCRPVGLVVA